ncbi:GMC family oxidoreductase [uncultured Thiothrix sp.]|uniref:GMC family oxidoreductase n=1 Tax=uncultured Thiothrix sp. TaxID=223185 RepID=UPI0026368CEC|nr:GMC family oxidoreductase N-terminal domain-containing protein [uncultured Thiothrix sp.]
MHQPKVEYDYIIVGAGSAGCILAERLSASGEFTVLVLEAGGTDNHPWFKMPMGYGKLYYNPRYNWMYYTTPQSALAQRNLYVPRGKVRGGSGAINAMIYVRGAAQDFDDWANATGDSGWSYQSVLPYFKRLENHWNPDSNWHGHEGKIHVSSLRSGMHPVCNNFLSACREIGFPENTDFNGAQLEGFGVYDVNIDHGIRDSSSRAYLQPALKRSNLSVQTEVVVERILFDEQKRAIAVQMAHADKPVVCHARREIIISAGAVESPKLLELSGIGNGAGLQNLGIPTVQHLPQVGEGLQDHLCASYYYKTNVPTLNERFNSLIEQAKMGLQYLLFKTGPLALSVNQTGGFFKTNPELVNPNIQLYFNPLSYTIPKDGKVAIKTDPYPGVLLAIAACRPSSRGNIHAISPASREKPAINPNYLSTEQDIQDALAASRLMRQIVQTRALQNIITEETIPGLPVQTDADMLEFFRANCGSIYHLCGTCAMGNSAENSVVDSQLRVHGVQGLRVVDASIFPNVTSGNINAPVMMVAERAADLILQAV